MAERSIIGYAYRHANGEVIGKPLAAVESGGGPYEYFNSPFVKDWWPVYGDPDDLSQRPTTEPGSEE